MVEQANNLRIRGYVRRLASIPLLPAALIALFLGFGIAEPNILSPRNIANILTQASYLSIFATAQTFVLISRGFDLSLGTLVSVVSVLSAMLMTALVPSVGVALAIVVAIIVGLSIGALMGILNGLLVSLVRINPFVATLGTMNICLGIATTVSGGFQIFGLPEQFSRAFTGSWMGLPVPVLIAGLFLLGVHVLLNYSVFGRRLFLIGANDRAAIASGIPISRTITYAFLACSLSAAFGALLLTARTGTGEPNLGGNLTLQSIAAAVMGGIPLSGGAGNILGPILGALLITILSNGMDLTRVNGDLQEIVLGIVIVTAVFVDRMRRRR